MNLWSNMFRYHRWANQAMIDFLRTLPDDHLALSVPGTYGNSLATIRHVVSSDADYVRIIPDAPTPTQIPQDGPFGGWDELRAIAWEADTALMGYVQDLTDDSFFVDVDDGISFQLTTSMLLTQIITHAMDHRSQINTTLSTHGIAVPETSVWAWRKSEDGQSLLAASREGHS